MKIVVETQHRENYGAHDWDGTGECPQHWKCKGGSTYLINNVSIAQSLDTQFWDTIRNTIHKVDDYFEEYIVGLELVDDVDYKPNHEHWDQPYVCDDIATGIFRKTEVGGCNEPVQASRRTLAMEDGNLQPQGVEYMIDDVWVSYSEGCEAVEAYRRAQEAA